MYHHLQFIMEFLGLNEVLELNTCSEVPWDGAGNGMIAVGIDFGNDACFLQHLVGPLRLSSQRLRLQHWCLKTVLQVEEGSV